MSLPAALLIVGIALSCSTACITSAVIQTVNNHAEAQARQTGEQNAAAVLAKNIHDRTGSNALPPVSADPRSLEAALRPALPQAPFGSEAADRNDVAVDLATGPNGWPVYTVTATGAFTRDYAVAFANYANRLRLTVHGGPSLVVKVFHAAPGSRRLFQRFDFN
jgi:hypothetical protein